MQYNLIQANKLRDKSSLKNIIENKPGYYKWWAEKKEVILLLKHLDLKTSIIDSLEKNNNKFCIYIGVAIKESVRDRLDWHINKINSPSAVRNGTLSTLRQTISSILFQDMNLTNETNEFIDKLYVQPFYINKPIKSQEAKEIIHNIEIDFLAHSDNLYLLNIQDNKHELSPRKKISALRKISKIAK